MDQVGFSSPMSREDIDIDAYLKRLDVNTPEEAQAFLMIIGSASTRWWIDLIKMKYNLEAIRLNSIKTSDSIETAGKKALVFAARRDSLFELLEYVESTRKTAMDIVEGKIEGE